MMRLLDVCVIHTMNGKESDQQANQGRPVSRPVNGSHHIYKHPAKAGHISIPHPKKDLGAGLVAKLLKAAGL